MEKTKKTAPERLPTLSTSLWMLLICVIVIGYVAIGLGLDVHVPLAFSCGILMLYGTLHLRIPFRELSKSMVEKISSGIEVFLIVLLIGSTIGTWIACGTVPLIIYYGLEIFSPQYFLVSVLGICSILSIITGSSWTTVGTLGIAFMGVGEGLGINPAMTAGAVICGSFFGDKQSPMSDSTNYAAAVAETDLYKHCRSMLYTTGPTMIVIAVIFTFLGFNHSAGSDTSVIEKLTAQLDAAFYLDPVLFLPLIVMVVMIVKKVPAIPTMMVAAVVGLIFAVVFQGAALVDVCKYFYSGFVGTTGDAAIDRLLTRGGMTSMYFTIGIMIWSLAMAGMMSRVGIIDAIMRKAQSITETPPRLVASHLVSGYVLTAISADIYLSMILPAKAFGQKYDELGLDRSVLSRTCEDGSTIVAPLIPWTTSAVFSATTRGVATMSYLPYYFLGYLNIIFVMLCAFSGFGMLKAASAREEENDEDVEKETVVSRA